MAIHEKAKPIEFTVDMSDVFDQGGELIKYDIIYEPDPTKEMLYPLTISAPEQNQLLQCPVEVLLEIVNFLTKKGLVKQPNVVPSPGTTIMNTGGSGSTLPMPQVQKKNGGLAPIPAESKASTPITSFDIAQDTPVTPAAVPAPAPTPAVVVGPVIGAPVVAAPVEGEVTAEMKARPVIRTRVKDVENDPQAAEREADLIRQQTQGGKKINFKSAHRSEEE